MSFRWVWVRNPLGQRVGGYLVMRIAGCPPRIVEVAGLCPVITKPGKG